MAILQVRNLLKVYPGKKPFLAVDGISFELKTSPDQYDKPIYCPVCEGYHITGGFCPKKPIGT